MVLVRRLVFWARVSWADGCTLLACSFFVFEQWALPNPRCLRLSISEVCQRLCVVGLASIYAYGP
jgi:hypothetical protein